MRKNVRFGLVETTLKESVWNHVKNLIGSINKPEIFMVFEGSRNLFKLIDT